MSNAPRDAAYALGRTSHETTRLIEQSKIYGGSTQRLLEAAGIANGMKVLEIGSGAGDVALILAELVGKAGRVVGVDVNAEILETARERAQAAGFTNVEFIAGDARKLELPNDFDALVGRFVLMYMANPSDALKHLVAHLRPDGIVAFQEPEYTIYPAVAHPDTPLMNQLISWIVEVFQATGAHLDKGIGLYRVFVEAGLPEPIMHFEAPVGAAETWAGYGYMATIFESLLPMLEKYDIATAAEVGVETLAARIREEVLIAKRPFFLPLHLSAYTRMSHLP